jgi:hypothetical protein
VSLEGIDVSHWQLQTPPLTGLAFAFAKASEGTTPDAGYSGHLGNFERAGLITGAYCFARDDVSLDGQAAFFVAEAGPTVHLLAVDVEGAHATDTAQTAFLISRIRVHDTLERAVLLYHSASGFFDAGQDADWIADYRSGASHAAPGTFWQWTSSPYDRDHFAGTLDDLHKLAKLVPAVVDGPPAQAKPSGATMWVEAAKLGKLWQRDGRGILRPIFRPTGFTFKSWAGDNATETWAPGKASLVRAEAVFRQLLGQPHNGLWVRVTDGGCTWHH